MTNGAVRAALVVLLAVPLLGRGQSNITYIYDELGRLVGVVDPASDAAIYRYDAVGNLLSISRFPSSQVSIIEFTPNSGPSGATVTVYGTGYSLTPSQNTLTFNGVAAPVTSSTITSIVATVPSGATSGPISVTSPSGSATSSMNFVVSSENGPPTITGFYPTGCPQCANNYGAGYSVTINGTNFSTITSQNRTKMNISLAPVTAAAATTLTATVPAVATSGRISLATPLGSTVSSADMFVAPYPFFASDIGFTGRAIPDGTGTVVSVPAWKIALLLFDGIAGQRVSVNLTDGVWPGFPCSLVYMLRPDGANQFWGACASNKFIDATTLPLTGTYELVIASQGGGGYGTAHVYVFQDFTSPITVNGAAVNPQFTIPGQNAALTFDGSPGQSVTAHLTNNSYAPGCVSMSLLNPDGTYLTGTNGCAASFNLGPQVLPVSGTYTVYVDPGLTSPGSATVSLTSP
jgi:YD repeat-containing protein